MQSATEQLLLELDEWRRTEASRLAIDPRFLVPDDLLAGIAESRPRSFQQLSEVDGMKPAVMNQFGRMILDAVAMASSGAPRYRPELMRGVLGGAPAEPEVETPAAPEIPMAERDGLFPFGAARPHQIDFLEDSREVLEASGHIVASVPTGVGKTAAALTAAVETAMRDQKTVLFVTSRVSQHKIAVDTLRRIGGVRVVDLIAKKRMCLHPDAPDNAAAFSEFCSILQRTRRCQWWEAPHEPMVAELSGEVMDVDQMVSRCEDHGVCPYKAATEAGKKAHVVVGDYNHLFSDMRSNFLPKLGKEEADLIVVVDEAHNLPDRIRSHLKMDLSMNMLSTAIAEARKAKDPFTERILKDLRSLIENLTAGIKDGAEERMQKDEIVLGIDRLLRSGLQTETADIPLFLERLEKVGKVIQGRSADPEAESALIFLHEFLSKWTLYAGSCVKILARETFGQLRLRLLDPSVISKSIFDQVAGSICMSGTLDPQMLADLLGIHTALLKSYPSPFDPRRRPIIVVNDVSTLYRERGPKMSTAIADQINSLVPVIPGNLAVFFQSYSMLKEIRQRLRSGDKQVIVESSNWSKSQRDKIVEQLIGLRDWGGGILLGVMGGSLSEGVDYTDNALDAVIVVGLPYAPPSVYQKALKEHFETRFGKQMGFRYSSYIPTMAKVKQAAGRAIRKADDRAVVVLMDRRFSAEARKIFPDGELAPATNPRRTVERFFSSRYQATLMREG